MTPAIVFIGDHALVFAWAFVAFGVASHLFVAWLNRPLWLRRFLRSLRRRGSV